jgi:type VI protein secretion system component VasK
LINEWNSTASAALKFENSFKTGFPFNNDSGPTVQEFNDFFYPMDGQLKKMFDNQAVLPDNLVSYLENAQRLRDAFYPANSRTASVPLQFAIERWSEPDKFVEVKIDNCPAASTQGLGSIPCTWPMPGGEVGAQIRILGTTDQKPIGEMKFPGEWGMFRMFNSGNPRPNSEGGYDLVWSVSGYTVRGKLKPSKTPNPFQRALYRDWQTPQNLSN